MLLLCLGLPAFAQQNPPVMPPIRLPYPQLVRYLELTQEQQAGLLRLQTEWQRYLAEKQRRAAEVTRELARETGARVPDPLSLGLRYAELEAICREARERDGQNMQSGRKLLSPGQMAKLQALEAAQALLPIILEAGQANLMPAQGVSVSSGNPAVNGVASIGLMVPSNYPGCRSATLVGEYAVLPDGVQSEVGSARAGN